MTAKTYTEEENKEKVEDDLSKVEVKSEDVVSEDKLAALKAKNQMKQQEQKMSAKIVAKKESIPMRRYQPFFETTILPSSSICCCTCGGKATLFSFNKS